MSARASRPTSPRCSAVSRSDSGKDLMLLSVTVDPDYDTPAVLAEYARRWARRPARLALSHRRCRRRSRPHWAKSTGPTKASIGHNSMTSIIGRDGRLAARGRWLELARGSTGEPDRASNWRNAMKIAVALRGCVGVGGRGANPKPADNCTPPPSALAPTLPARLLPGMGTVHLAITTTQSRSAAVLRPGTGADALLLGARGGAQSSCRRPRSTRQRPCRNGASRWWRRAIGVRASRSIC